MIVECGHCGAPLDIEEGRSVVTCAYCTKKNHVAALKTIAPVTPSDFKPPSSWRPPTTASASSATSLTYHPTEKRSKRRWLLGAIPVVIIAGIVWWSVTRGATVEQIANQPLERTAAEIERDLYVTYKTDDGVRVTFRSGAAGPYEHVWYRWADGDSTLPSSIGLFVVEGATIQPRVLPALDKSLHGGIADNGSWRWGPVAIHVDLKTGMLSVDVAATHANRPNLLRRRQLAAGWQIIRTAAFGGPDVPASELVAVLGGGYPTKDMGAFNPGTPLARAREEVLKMFPGALVEDTRFEIALDHPLVYSVQLSWHNAADGRMHGTHFRLTPEYGKRRMAWMACMTKEAGAPTESITDFAKGTKSFAYAIRGDDPFAPRVDLHTDEDSLYIVTSGSVDGAVAWQRAFALLDRCR